MTRRNIGLGPPNVGERLWIVEDGQGLQPILMVDDYRPGEGRCTYLEEFLCIDSGGEPAQVGVDQSWHCAS